MGARNTRQRRPRRASAPRVLLLVCGVAMFCVGCNIFSWTHDEGSSDDPETLLEDAEDALLNRDYGDALRFAQKGIDNDPELRVWRLRYVASQAVLGDAGISITDYYGIFTNQGPPTKAPRDDNTPVLRYDLLNLSLEELEAIAAACPQAIAYLRELVEGLENGTITSADLGGALFDVDVGFAVGSLLTAFVTILDAGQDLSDGFQQTPDIVIIADESGGYDIQYTGSLPTNPYIAQELLCPLWNRASDSVPGFASIMEALEGVYDAYLVAVGGDRALDIGCTGAGLGSKPAHIDTDIIVGQMLDFVYDGVRALYDRYVATFCPCAGGSS